MIIAEIGNNHLGDMDLARELIKEAVDSGADLVKGQAIDPTVVKGSMPTKFYGQCALDEKDYIDLIYYARSLGSDMFYSVFGSFPIITEFQRFQKLAASQSKQPWVVKQHDRKNTFISFNLIPVIVKEAILLYATEYNNKSDVMIHIDRFEEILDTNVGLSDHSIGIDQCLNAIENNVSVIEKHFCLEHQRNNIKYKGILFRDCVHSMIPSELKELSNAMSSVQK